MATHVDLPVSKCPQCGITLGAASNADGDRLSPEPGSLSVCIGCQAILEFDDDLQLMTLTNETRAQLDDETMDYLEQIQRNLALALRKHASVH